MSSLCEGIIFPSLDFFSGSSGYNRFKLFPGRVPDGPEVRDGYLRFVEYRRKVVVNCSKVFVGKDDIFSCDGLFHMLRPRSSETYPEPARP